MIKNNLFGEVLNGKKGIESFDTCNLVELKQMINSAASRKQRTEEKVKYDRVIQLEARLKELAAALTVKPTGVWRTADPETMSLELINHAVALAQSVKCSYGPTKVKFWKSVDRNDDRFAWAQHNIEVAEVKYPQSLIDEDKWIALRDVRFPDGNAPVIAAKAAEAKVVAEQAEVRNTTIQGLIATLEAKGKLSKTDEVILAQLKAII